MSAVTGVIKIGDTYVLVSGSNIIRRVYIPNNCFSYCTANLSHPDCPCHAVQLVNQLSLSGKLVDIKDCYDILSCINKLNQR